jgi:ribonucleoside-diphosphate reductase alpha chain
MPSITRHEELILNRLRDEVGLPKSTSKRIAKKLEILSRSVTWATPPNTRRKLRSERNSITHKFSISGHEGFLTVGMYEDGTPGELLIKLAKEGSTLAGVLDGLSVTFSVGLQYGVPLRSIVDKFVGMRFEPFGYTSNPRIHYAKSLLDYVGRYLGGRFISSDYLDPTPGESPHSKQNVVQAAKESRKSEPNILSRRKRAKRK